MLTLLKEIVEFFTFIPDYILYAIETLFNLLMSGIYLIFVAATELIPLPEVPTPPEFVANINWFFPIGALISIATPVVAGYVSFLLIRWIYQKVGEL